MTCVLMLGSGPSVTEAANWPRAPFDAILAINNAHAVRPDWTHHIYPWDFPADRRPTPRAGQQTITQDDFVPAQNAFGGFVYAGGTMAFTAAYWALHALKPSVIAAFGCDMHYPKGQTHFYGAGTADPLRPDITLQSLEAKSARLMILAAMEGCAMVNLSFGPSRLIFPRMARERAAHARPMPFDIRLADAALKREDALGYHVPSGRYWEEAHRFDPAELRRIDMLWLSAARMGLAATA
ncbi:hypothetical protein [Tabrizicola sp. M-4]|uniref:hypothetical protein n=1 Tax=Tabrizicola sp. M-4 TaxID=3055847 RepID=UPI003DA7C78F